MKYFLNFIIYVIVIGINAISAQDVRMDFTAFGNTPQVVNEDLYEKLSQANNSIDRSFYLDTIAQLFAVSGNADSLMKYGGLLKNELLRSSNTDRATKDYQLKAYLYQGTAAQKIGLLDEAIGYFIKGLEVEADNDNLQNALKLQLANTYIFKNELDKAEALLNELPQENVDSLFNLQTIIAKSRFLTANNEYDFAEKQIQQGLNGIPKDAFIKERLELQLVKSNLELREQNYQNTLNTCRVFKNEALNEGIYDLYIEFSINEGFALAKTNNYSAAEMALSSAYANTLQWNRLELQKRIIGALVKLYSAQKKYDNAYALMTQLQNANNTIAKRQNQRVIKDLEFKYETLQKEKEIDKLQEDQILKQTGIEHQKTVKYAFLIGFIVILIPVILLLVVYYQKLQTQSLLNKQQEALNQQEVKSLMQAQELSLAKNTIAVQTKERNRIARELHDSIGGNLAGIKLKMNSLGEEHPDFKTILSQLDTTYDQVREISHSLIPKEFENTNFTDVIKSHIASIQSDDAINLRFNVHPKEDIDNLESSLQVNLFNIIKELITNANKHSKASEIEMQLTYFAEENSLELLYEDDGIGFDLLSENKGIGLKNIENRIEELNGKLSINTAPNRGTVISISIPLVENLTQ